MKILFAYKGRYHIRDAVTLELLSAIAGGHGHETGLLYDPDIFGVTDNVLSSRALHRIFSARKRVVSRVLGSGAHLAVFLDGFTRRGWNSGISAEVKKRNPRIKTALLSYTAPGGGYDYVLKGEPEFSFERFFSDGVMNSREGEYSFKGLADLDKIPFPDKGLFAPYVNFSGSYMIYTGKGCRYGCSYCEETVYKNALGGGYVRRRSPANVIAELEQAKEVLRIREVIYKDSVFALDKGWLEDYLKLYSGRIALPYKCFAKAEAFDEEMAMRLKDSGCYSVEFGVQTFNEALKRDVLRREEKNGTLLTAFSICDRVKLRYDADHLFGIPGESIDDHKKAASIYSGLGYINRIKCHNLTYYKEAPLYEHAPKPVKDDNGYNADFFSSVAGDPEMKAANKAFQKYFKVMPLLPGFKRRFLNMGENWRIFAFVPSFFIIFLMLIIGIKNRDRRFLYYLTYYPQRVIRAVLKVGDRFHQGE